MSRPFGIAIDNVTERPFLCSIELIGFDGFTSKDGSYLHDRQYFRENGQLYFIMYDPSEMAKGLESVDELTVSDLYEEIEYRREEWYSSDDWDEKEWEEYYLIKGV
jgi:hypothetical protein